MAGIEILFDAKMSDIEKEKKLRHAGVSLIVSALWLLFDLVWISVLSVINVIALMLFDIYDWNAIFGAISQWPFIVGSFALLIVILLFPKQKKSTTPDKNVSHYSDVDKFYHYIAFSSVIMFMKIAKLDDLFLSKSDKKIAPKPIFITSLARGGTTALLLALNSSVEIASHKYNNMPFLSAPLIWRFVSKILRRNIPRQERAHGDGIEIDLDTPEAFEEAIWKMWFPQNYAGDKISLWEKSLDNKDFQSFLNRHFQKIVKIRSSENDVPTTQVRYMSKNNTNISRIPLLKDMYDDSVIIVPLRRPAPHAHSLFRQHSNFCALQNSDPFIARYMSDIGHFEFGAMHKPIAFENSDIETRNANEHDYWLSYWLGCFEQLHDYKDDCIFVCQDDLRSDPTKTMLKLHDVLNIQSSLTDFSSFFRSEEDLADLTVFDSDLLAKADKLYDDLKALAI